MHRGATNQASLVSLPTGHTRRRARPLLGYVKSDRLALVMVGEMVIPVPALPLLFQITVADGVPEWDVTSSCRAGAVATQGASAETRLKACIDSEHRTRKEGSHS
jgi:hypothetical protein